MESRLARFRGSWETATPVSDSPALPLSFVPVVVTIRVLALGALCSLLGCAFPGRGPVANAPVSISNPLLVSTRNEELVWERAVDVLHDFQFEIAQENRLGRVIETIPKVGANVLEPWHHDSVGLDNRLESSLQSIRRIVQLSLLPDESGTGYLVSVVALKEREDLPGVAGNSAGAATFSESTPLIRNLNPVVGQSSPSIWLPLGRDGLLEQAILQRLRAVYSL